MSPILEIRDLSCGYQKGINVLHDISLSINKGEAVGVIGLNGSGKSTLGKALMNLLPFRSGSILYKGQETGGKCTNELSEMGMAIMLQGGVVFQNLSVADNLIFAKGKGLDLAYMEQLKELIPLLSDSRKQNLIADRLSGGERLQLALAMTLFRKPELIILDEPSAGLSPTSLDAAYTLLTKMRGLFGTSIILIEQNVSRAHSFCERTLVLEAGRIIYEADRNDADMLRIESLLFNGTLL